MPGQVHLYPFWIHYKHTAATVKLIGSGRQQLRCAMCPVFGVESLFPVTSRPESATIASGGREEVHHGPGSQDKAASH